MAGRVGKFGAMLGTVMVALKLKELYDECKWLMTPMLLLLVFSGFTTAAAIRGYVSRLVAPQRGRRTQPWPRGVEDPQP